jgi:hypothetical protein
MLVGIIQELFNFGSLVRARNRITFILTFCKFKIFKSHRTPQWTD